MRRKTIYSVLLCAALTVVLAGCGDGSEENDGTGSNEVMVLTAEPLPSEEDREISDYELKYSNGEFVMEDYQALAGLYAEAGQIRKQRDMLEQSYRLYNDTQAFETLQSIAVNLMEEEAALSEAETMLQNLKLPEYLSEAVHMIGSDEWIDTMMPKLYEGKRNYFLTEEGKTALSIQAGFDEAGLPFSNVWYKTTEDSGDKIILLSRSGNTLQFLTTGLTDTSYDGAFELWGIDRSSGSIYREQGTFVKGVYTGDYTVSLHSGSSAGDFFDLWNNREGMEYVTYTGSFDSEGKTTLQQPSSAEIKKLLDGYTAASCVVYAYGSDKSDCLFLPLEEGMEAANYSFHTSAMGLAAYAEFTPYEANAAETPGDIQVRIFDGEVQYFDGTAWLNAGDVDSLIKKDPYQAYSKEREARLAGDSIPDAEGGEPGTEDRDRFHTGTINKTTSPVSATPTPKPATNKPGGGAIATPAPTPAPTPTPAPPAPEPDDDDDDGGSDSSGSDSSGGNDSGGSNSGDVDIEWTDDIL